MNNNASFQQPLNENMASSSAPAPRQVSDFVNEFRDWWMKVPLMTKY